MNRRTAIASIIASAVLVLSALFGTFAGHQAQAAPAPAVVEALQNSPASISPWPLTLISSQMTQTITTTARFYGDASYLDVYGTVVSGTGNITVTMWHSSNGSDWFSQGQVFTATSGTNAFSRTVAYGGYYRLVVNAPSTGITPTIRIVTKP